jgi:nitric oxide reductase NorD protein
VDAAVARYRLLAVEQAERLTRGTAMHAPFVDQMVHDLYLMRAAAAVDARIVQSMPGMSRVLESERAAALRRRPRIHRLTRHERHVEELLRKTLARPSAEESSATHDPRESLAWAHKTAMMVRGTRGVYRGIPLAAFWGMVLRRKETREGIGIAEDQSAKSAETMPDPKAPPSENADESNAGGRPDDGSAGPWSALDAPKASTSSRGIVVGDDELQIVDEDTSRALPGDLAYDEWDAEASAYIRRAATVRLHEPDVGDRLWATTELARHGALVRRIRTQFERLRARRALLTRQRAGDDLDIESCVHAIVDRRIGQTPDDRLYLDARPARRGVALALLVDVSGSTEAGVGDGLRIIDVERIALLLAGQALDALGDLYAVYAFAGKDASNVKITTIKDFSERNNDVVQSRVAGLTPGGFTRLGAAVRHATRQLARQSAGHRLLLILSDGRPNDVDRYQGPYGVEDSRQAIFEARASGVYPFCITVDHQASEYLPRIFGKAGHTIVQRPEQLPTALLTVVQALIRRG